jgi:hypothetical protein
MSESGWLGIEVADASETLRESPDWLRSGEGIVYGTDQSLRDQCAEPITVDHDDWEDLGH